MIKRIQILRVSDGKAAGIWFSDILDDKKAGIVSTIRAGKNKEGISSIYLIKDLKESFILKTIHTKIDNPEAIKNAEIEYETIRILNSKTEYIAKALRRRPVKVDMDSKNYFESLYEYSDENLLMLDKTTKITGKQIITFAIQSAESMRQAHKLKFFHLDLKPENMIFKEQILRIVNFDGASKITADKIKDLSQNYYHPEISNNIKCKFKLKAWDAFSWGMTFYQIISKKDKQELINEWQNLNKENDNIDSFYCNIKWKNIPKDINKENADDFMKILKAAIAFDPKKRLSFSKICKKMQKKIPSIYAELHIRTHDQLLNDLHNIGNNPSKIKGKKEEALTNLEIKKEEKKAGKGENIYSIEKCKYLEFWESDILDGTGAKNVKKIKLNEEESTKKKTGVFLVNCEKESYILKTIKTDNESEIKKAEEEYENTLKLSNQTEFVAKALKRRPEKADATGKNYFEALYENGGKNLLQLMDKLTGELLIIWAIQSAEAMKIVHKLKLFHSDLKPENMTFRDNVLKIIDFGESVGDSGTTTFKKFGQTVDSKIKGVTYCYCPPEILKYDIQKISFTTIDIYCWGMSFYQFISNKSTSMLVEESKKYKKDVTEYKLFTDSIVWEKIPDDLTKENANNFLEIVKSTLAFEPKERLRFFEICKNLSNKFPLIYKKALKNCKNIPIYPIDSTRIDKKQEKVKVEISKTEKNIDKTKEIIGQNIENRINYVNAEYIKAKHFSLNNLKFNSLYESVGDAYIVNLLSLCKDFTVIKRAFLDLIFQIKEQKCYFDIGLLPEEYGKVAGEIVRNLLFLLDEIKNTFSNIRIQ